MPGPTISAIVDRVKSAGFANPSKYYVRIYRQNYVLNSMNTEFERDIAINCEMVSLPGFNVMTADKRYYGPTNKMPYGESGGDLSMSFYCSEDHRERRYFEKWLHVIRNPATFDIGYASEYYSTIDVVNLNNSDKASLRVKYLDCYPIAISPIDLGYSNTSTIEKLLVTFTYSRYQPFETDSAITTTIINPNLPQP